MQDSDNNATPSVPQLLSAEARVLGSLMEKQLNTPDQYPLTLNSLMSACNQKSSRDPVTNYTQGEVARTLIELENRKFVQKEYGSRAEKYSQNFIHSLGLTKKHQALLCVMLLRGPQTLSELNTRTQRMVEFSDKNELQHTLDRLCDREVPFAVRLSQQPGQRGERFAHLFSGAPTAATQAHAATSTSTASEEPSRLTHSGTDNHSNPSTQLQDEVSQLKQEVAALKQEFSELKQQLDTMNQHFE